MPGAYTYTSDASPPPPPAAGLALQSVSPSTGSSEGGTVVLITGGGFAEGVQVSFGTVPAAAVTFFDAATIQATTSPSAQGTVDVVVTNPDGQSAVLPGAFTFGAPQSPGQGVVITITRDGVSPKDVEIAPGTRVTFINNDTRNHDMVSDPHPEHTDCPEINDVSFLTPGQRAETAAFETPKTCGFHDHNQSSNDSLRGRIVVR
jgi:plastocyanin